jgi:hypothetical protein
MHHVHKWRGTASFNKTRAIAVSPLLVRFIIKMDTYVTGCA